MTVHFDKEGLFSLCRLFLDVKKRMNKFKLSRERISILKTTKLSILSIQEK